MTASSQSVEPFDLVIFGGTGDLAVRKLLPALFHRFLDGQIPASSRIVGIARDSTYDAFGEAAAPAIFFSYRDRPQMQGELHLRTREDAVQDFFKNHLAASFNAYLKTKEEFDNRFRTMLEMAAAAPQMWEKLIPGAEVMREILTGKKKDEEEENT